MPYAHDRVHGGLWGGGVYGAHAHAAAEAWLKGELRKCSFWDLEAGRVRMRGRGWAYLEGLRGRVRDLALPRHRPTVEDEQQL